jgi:hypothetical protein
MKNSQYPASAAGHRQAGDLYALPVTLKGLGHEMNTIMYININKSRHLMKA